MYLSQRATPNGPWEDRCGAEAKPTTSIGFRNTRMPANGRSSASRQNGRVTQLRGSFHTHGPEGYTSIELIGGGFGRSDDPRCGAGIAGARRWRVPPGVTHLGQKLVVERGQRPALPVARRIPSLSAYQVTRLGCGETQQVGYPRHRRGPAAVHPENQDPFRSHVRAPTDGRRCDGPISSDRRSGPAHGSSAAVR